MGGREGAEEVVGRVAGEEGIDLFSWAFDVGVGKVVLFDRMIFRS